MNRRISRSVASLAVLAGALLLAEPAAAFRCGSKLAKEGMHELEIVAICGEPASIRHLGYAIRSVEFTAGRPIAPGWTISRFPGYGTFTAEVVITEYVYNLGPRKLMRRLVFEGGLLVSIETLGHGYNENSH